MNYIIKHNNYKNMELVEFSEVGLEELKVFLNDENNIEWFNGFVNECDTRSTIIYGACEHNKYSVLNLIIDSFDMYNYRHKIIRKMNQSCCCFEESIDSNYITNELYYKFRKQFEELKQEFNKIKTILKQCGIKDGSEEMMNLLNYNFAGSNFEKDIIDIEWKNLITTIRNRNNYISICSEGVECWDCSDMYILNFKDEEVG